MELVVHCDADALLALTHAEGAAQVNFLLQAVVRDELLELLNHLTGTLIWQELPMHTVTFIILTS